MSSTLCIIAVLFVATGCWSAELKHEKHLVKRQADECPDGLKFMECGYPCRSSCRNYYPNSDCKCVPGCYCEDPDLVMSEDGKSCIKPDSCKYCKHDNGTLYYEGQGYTNEETGETCFCNGETWDCDKREPCKCRGTGDPHYTTCDNTEFDFQGDCSYYLAQGNGYIIEAKNEPCGSATCTESITITFGGDVILIKRNLDAYVNGNQVSLPYTALNNYILQLSTNMELVASLSNGIVVTIWKRGFEVELPPKFVGNTNGLCGTYNSNPADDFLTSYGFLTTDDHIFANSWKTDFINCKNAAPGSIGRKKRAVAPKELEVAKAVCGKLREKVFASCHAVKNVDVAYKNCLYDINKNDINLNSFACDSLASYAQACTSATTSLAWRDQVPECKVVCTAGQVFQTCNDGCSRSCGDLSISSSCPKKCSEGCVCPKGTYLDNALGKCVSIGSCSCYYNNAMYKPKATIVINKQSVTCINGQWVSVKGQVVSGLGYEDFRMSLTKPSAVIESAVASVAAVKVGK